MCGDQLKWFDAHLWAYAEHYGLAEILTEDLQHDRLYGMVRVVNPFADAQVTGRPYHRRPCGVRLLQGSLVPHAFGDVASLGRDEHDV